MQNSRPTAEQFSAYQGMADYFNETLFGGELPPVILNFSRKGKTFGFFAPRRWNKGAEVCHEISLNPEHMATRPMKATASTLVHEMVHLWQQEFGSPSRNGYHNREWGDRMREVGLMPSSTGGPGGKTTGQRVSHWIAAGGPFERAFDAMPEELSLPWLGVLEPEPEKKQAGRFKYTCAGCGVKAWAKEGVKLVCGDCEAELDGTPVGADA